MNGIGNRIALIAATAALVLGPSLGGTARAEDDDATYRQRWDDLRHAVFGDRKIETGMGVITLDAPPRALDAALVPLTIDLPGTQKIKAVYLIVDGNTSPLAGTIHFGPAADTRELKTRVRVDAYTLIHAVAETEDGKLYATESFIKASGGCSAPSTENAQLALERLGQMKLKRVGAAGSDAVQLLISHPNYNGMQMDQVTRNYTPARYIQDIKVTRGDALVFDFESDISLSEDPAITFGLADKTQHTPLSVEVLDSSKAVFKQNFDIPGNGA
jgi:sulfur-oxidizing protein SoxY